MNVSLIQRRKPRQRLKEGRLARLVVLLLLQPSILPHTRGASPIRVTEIHQIPRPLQEMVNSGGRLFFPEYDREHGTELWKSDGMSAGTVRVRDIQPGSF